MRCQKWVADNIDKLYSGFKGTKLVHDKHEGHMCHKKKQNTVEKLKESVHGKESASSLNTKREKQNLEKNLLEIIDGWISDKQRRQRMKNLDRIRRLVAPEMPYEQKRKGIDDIMTKVLVFLKWNSQGDVER